MDLKQCDVVLCEFYFSNMNQTKKRPVLIFKDNLPYDDFVGIPISSKIMNLKEDEILIDNIWQILYYTDRSNSKVHPILIIRKNSFDDYIYIPITSQNDNMETSEIDNIYFEYGNIKKKSYLVLDKLCSISRNMLVREIGKFKNEYFEEILKKYCKNLQSKT